MEQNLNENKSHEKKIWITPDVELISTDVILGGSQLFDEISTAAGHHGSHS